jgi:putative nucleotidyltransferase with HDIG domain
MEREIALAAIERSVANRNLIAHMLATEAIMRALAVRFGEDADVWGVTGLLHDIDVETTEGDMQRHAKEGAEMARELGASEAQAAAILKHNETHGLPRETLLEKALYCADPLSGLITAAALIRPEKQLANVELKSVRKRFKERSFAAGANREQIALCSEIDLELDDFLEIGLAAMKQVAPELGL